MTAMLEAEAVLVTARRAGRRRRDSLVVLGNREAFATDWNYRGR